jgi:hypothetical protein
LKTDYNFQIAVEDHMNRHLKSLIVSAVMVVFSITGASVAEAADCGDLGDDCFTRVYAGISVGEATHESDDLAQFAVDDQEISAGVLVGYRVNKFIGWEVAGKYFGQPDYTDVNGDLEGRVCNLSFGANLYLPLGELISDPDLNFFSLFVKGGGHYWDSELEYVTGALAGTSPINEDGVDLFYGYGINIDFAKYFTLRIEQSIYQVDFNAGPAGDDEVVENSLNFIVKF